ncbi:MAG TPA: cupin domain-containing protein [Terriglobales bacterium]|jgi:gentisate 1,2-dioxygenase|nr:cupin domain-containing protein [Terriglobales bacterium]
MNLEELDRQLGKSQLSGFWRTRVPLHSSEAPYLWKWKPVLDGLLKAGETIGIEQAERRAIRLVSPYLPIPSTSHTLQVTFSVVNPGEVARAHRHNMAAIRFVVQGKGAYTAVDGEKFFMEEGDLILTPNWTWHDHHNESHDPIIWLDGLDGPLIQSLNVLFFEEAKIPEQPITKQTGESLSRFGFARAPKTEESSRRGVAFRYTWKETHAALRAIGDHDRDLFDGRLLRYINPATGGFTYPTMSCEIQLFKGKESTATHRHTSTAIFHVVRGQGRTRVGEGYLEWQQGDTFVVPLWQWHSHENLANDEAVLFSINDRPVMDALQLYREEAAG